MFFVEGYVPLAIVTRRLLAENELMHRVQFPFVESEWDDVNAYEGWIQHVSRYEGLQDVWTFIENCKFRGVLMPNGNVIQVVYDFFGWWDPSSADAPNVNLFLGTVGSGEGFEEDRESEDGPIQEALLRQRFGAFLFQPIVFMSKEFDEHLKRLSRWEGNPNAATPAAGEIVKEIVRRFDIGETVTKKWVRQHLAQSMKAVEFAATWKMASDQRPRLSKPGPRGPRR